MAIDKSALAAYSSQNQSELLVKAQVGAPSIALFNKMLNVKGATTLNILNTVVELQPANCSFTAKGDDKLSQRTIEAKAVVSEKEYCPESLMGTWMQNDLLIKAGAEKLPFEEKFVDGLVAGFTAAIEKNIWQGDTTKSANNAFDGIIKIAEAATLAATNEYAQGATISSIVDGLIEKLPEEVYAAGTPCIFMGSKEYDKYLQELRANGNLVLNIAGWDNVTAPESITVPATRGVKVYGVPGLSNTGKFFASYAENFYFGTDVEDALSTVKVWYSDDNQVFRSVIKTTAGVQIAFPELCVMAKEQQ